MDFSQKIVDLCREAEKALAPQFARIDEVSFANTAKVMKSFREHRVSDTMFIPTSGYGYDDHGREVLDAVWADVFGAEAAKLPSASVL